MRIQGETSGCSYRITAENPEKETKVFEGSPEEIRIENPSLWWPNGLGEQPLYTVRTELLCGESVVDEMVEQRVRLRTMTMHVEKDEFGESFAHEVNGSAVFAMGADYIPEDHLLGRTTRKRQESFWKTAGPLISMLSACGAAGIILRIGSMISATSWDFWYGRTLCLPARSMI